MKQHKHKWKGKKKFIKQGILGLSSYWANTAQCKCGEWYYITVRSLEEFNQSL